MLLTSLVVWSTMRLLRLEGLHSFHHVANGVPPTFYGMKIVTHAPVQRREQQQLTPLVDPECTAG